MLTNLYELESAPRTAEEVVDVVNAKRGAIKAQRGAQYGSGVEAFERHRQVGRLWASFLSLKLGTEVPDIEPETVSHMMALYKISRIACSDSADHYMDAANFLDMGLDMAVRRMEKDYGGGWFTDLFSFSGVHRFLKPLVVVKPCTKQDTRTPPSRSSSAWSPAEPIGGYMACEEPEGEEMNQVLGKTLECVQGTTQKTTLAATVAVNTPADTMELESSNAVVQG